MLTANPGFEFARSLPSPLGETSWTVVRQLLAALRKEGLRQLVEMGVPKDDARIEVAVDVRHRGQGDALTVELGPQIHRGRPERQVEGAFQDAYVRLYGHRPPGVEPEAMTWRVRVLGPEPELDVTLSRRRTFDSRKGTRPVWFAETGRFLRTAVHDRYRLPTGTALAGPAVIEERESTVVVGPGASATVDRVGSLVVTAG
jgi:N-methylhydantoinase A